MVPMVGAGSPTLILPHCPLAAFNVQFCHWHVETSRDPALAGDGAMAAQHWVSLLPALGEPTDNSGEGSRVLVGVKCASPEFTPGVGWPAGSQGAGTEGRCSTAHPERLWVLLTG